MRRQMLALILVLSVAWAQRHVDLEESYASAGSEDIYFQPVSNQDDMEYVEDVVDEDGDDDDSQYMEHVVEDHELKQEEAAEPEPELGQNIEAIGENESSCEYSCPRYYRPLCVRRNGSLVTFATPCEYHNQLRCANVARRRGQNDTPTFQWLYNNACKQH